MARAYRRARPSPRPAAAAGWLAALSESEREGFRSRGVELVGNLLAYLDAQPGREAALFDVAERHAREYGAETAKTGASLSDTVEGFLQFRRPFMDELALLARHRHLDTREATELLADADTALDRLLVALMLGHRSSAAHE